MLLGCQSARQDDYDEIFQAQNIDYLLALSGQRRNWDIFLIFLRK